MQLRIMEKRFMLEASNKFEWEVEQIELQRIKEEKIVNLNY